MARAVNYKTRHQFSISDFGGVDLSSSPVKISSNRASYMRNFYKDEGVISKRPGFLEVARIKGEIKKIVKFGKDVFVFSISEETSEEISEEISEETSEETSEEISEEISEETSEETSEEISKKMGYAYKWDGTSRTPEEIGKFEAEVIEVFYNKERLYILTGKTYIVLYKDGDKYVTEDVSDNAYIPTTTAGITDNLALTENRYTLDAVNMLTSKRKNLLKARATERETVTTQFALTIPYNERLGGSGTQENPYVWEFDYYIGKKKSVWGKYVIEIPVMTQVDGTIEFVTAYYHEGYSKSTDNVYHFVTIDQSLKGVQINEFVKVTIDVNRQKLIIKATIEDIGSMPTVFPGEEKCIITVTYEPILEQSWKLDGSIDSETEVSLLLVTEDSDMKASNRLTESEEKNVFGNSLYVFSDESREEIGTVNFKEGIITINNASIYSDITVTFSHSSKREETDYPDLVKNCRFGTIFGTTGNSNRLFISGNPSFPNMEFWSESEDYTYFPDLNYNTVGSDLTAIVGYSRLSDEVLAVFKERGGVEPTVYYKTGDYNGDNRD